MSELKPCPFCAGCAFDDRYDEKRCRALRNREQGECKFKKTPDELAESRTIANARLRELPETTQKRIAGKYNIKRKAWDE